LLRLDPREALALALAGRLFDLRHGSSRGGMFSDLIRRIAPLFGGALSIAADSLDTILSAPHSVLFRNNPCSDCPFTSWV